MIGPCFADVWAAPLGWVFLRPRSDGRGGVAWEFYDTASATWGRYRDGLVIPCVRAAPDGPLKNLQGAVTIDPPGPCLLGTFELDANGVPRAAVRTEAVGVPGYAPILLLE